MSVALRDHYFQPWSIIESFFFVFGLYLVFKKSNAALAVVIVLASLNRETSILIPLAFLLGNCACSESRNTKSGLLCAPSRHVIGQFIMYASLSIFVLVIVRYLLGSAENVNSIPELWSINTTEANLVKAVVNVALFLGIFWAFAVLGFRGAPDFIRRTSLVMPFYLIPIIVLGVWFEVRLLMPVYALLVPLGVSYLSRRTKDGLSNPIE
jgi:branched-subunit amino acid transport protein AzlD